MFALNAFIIPLFAYKINRRHYILCKETFIVYDNIVRM